MKIRRSLFWFTVICIALMVIIVWFGRKPDQASLPAVGETNAASSPKAAHAETAPTHQSGSPLQTNRAVAASVPNAPPTAVPPKTKGEQMKEALAAFNDEDVVLYGRVIDQFSNAVANATITGSIQVNNGTRVGADKITLLTDANGFFTISGYQGKALGIWATKKGYVMATPDTRFVYSHLWSEAERYNPDPNNPAVIKMWKLQGAEQLTGINQRYKFHFSEAPIRFDLLAGKIVPTGGDIKITVRRSPGVVSERTLQDWSVQIEAVDGGLIEASAEDARFVYELPDGGYQSGYTYTMSTNTQSWHGALDQMFYLRSRNGQVFSKLIFGISINRQPDDYVWVEFHGELNSSGSRNFEADAGAMAMKQP
ncbi:MAG TPA: carboxypeptidase-like regulatory domain-containing protein [Verrucomicrobiae bacterium]|nr:carboxypeptidase-like regulatory domain-containing protein [Verrucomicrobiae bacterium]